MENFAFDKMNTKYLKITASIKMQKICIWETGYKIPNIERIKLRCKNSASGNWIKNT